MEHSMSAYQTTDLRPEAMAAHTHAWVLVHSGLTVCQTCGARSDDPTDAYEPVRIQLTQPQWEEIIAHGAAKGSDLYCGAVGCIKQTLTKPDCTVDEIRTILAALDVVWEAHMATLQGVSFAPVPVGVEGWSINGRSE
jgi:hypothetical protein